MTSDASGGDTGRPPVADSAGLLEGLQPVAASHAGPLEVSSYYRAGGSDVVGGDWFDVLELPGGGVGVVVGDVAGRGAAAAGTMTRLRHGACAYLLDERDPAALLARMNRLATWAMPGEVATVVVALFVEDSVAVASAGHLPPLLVCGGTATYLDIAAGPALGVVEGPTYGLTDHDFVGDALLVLYTDGLVERRGETIDDGLERLRSVAEMHAGDSDLCDHLVTNVPAPDGADDLSLVALSPR